MFHSSKELQKKTELFAENKAQNETNHATMLFTSKQVSLPKISSILQKIKNLLKML